MAFSFGAPGAPAVGGNISADELAMRSLIQQNLTVEADAKQTQTGAGRVVQSVAFRVTRTSGPRIVSWQMVLMGTDDRLIRVLEGRDMPGTITWDGRNTGGKTAPDGEYRIRVEFTEANAQGPVTPAAHIRFVKGPEAATVTPENLAHFDGMSRQWAPEAATR